MGNRRRHILSVAGAMIMSVSVLTQAHAADTTDVLQQEINDVLAKTEGASRLARTRSLGMAARS